MPQLNTTLGLSANATSKGQEVDFDDAVVFGLTITNNSGQDIQYSPDGTTWTTVANGASASPSVPSPAAFRLRKTSTDSIPVPVRLSWAAGDGIARFTSDGTWLVRPDGASIRFPYMLAPSAVPVGVPSSGSIGNNGALTLGTAFQFVYSGGIYLYFPASAIFAGSAAGLYWTVMSSTTAGTIYNNVYTAGPALPPSVLTPFVTTGPGAYTQVTSEITVRTVTLPGKSLGPNGWLDATIMGTFPSTAGNKTPRIRFAGNLLYANAYTTFLGHYAIASIANRGAEAIQVQPLSGSSGGTGSVQISQNTVDTSADQTVSVSMQLAAATDYAVSEAARFMVTPS